MTDEFDPAAVVTLTSDLVRLRTVNDGLNTDGLNNDSAKHDSANNDSAQNDRTTRQRWKAPPPGW